MTQHLHSVGDKVIFTNIFGVCWGVKTITALDERHGPTYHFEPTDTPWFSTPESNLRPADTEDLIMDEWGFDKKWDFFQQKYGFTPTELFGCW